ncbi:MAG: mannitol dehydrogenase family protein [Halioglobus sp.]
MKRLSVNNVGALAPEIRTSNYHRDRIDIGIVHFGIGAFHRAHQALYTEEVLNQVGGNWGICGVSLRSPNVRGQMEPQNCLYTISTNSAAGNDLQVVGAVKEVLVASESPEMVIERLCLPTLHVITLTITEKGYCLNPATGLLDLSHPDIRHDYANCQQPKSAIGFISRGLEQRYKNNLSGLTIISCDNWFANGKRLGDAVLEFCRGIDPKLPAWVAEYCRFPNTMVDRIVPVTSDDDRKRLAERLGYEDKACVNTEPFSQWVIENKFAGPVPDWNLAGASFVDDVSPFEEMKLRLLNGSHSTLAYLACLGGISTVSDAIANQDIRCAINHLMRREVIPTLSIPDDFDIDDYAGQLIERFTNPALAHQTRQIAMDGSQKIPQRLLPPLLDRLQKGESIEVLTLGVAAWIRYTRGVDDSGEDYTLDDPMAERLKALHQTAGTQPENYMPAILGITEVFDMELGNNQVFKDYLLEVLQKLEAIGALATVKEIMAPLSEHHD